MNKETYPELKCDPSFEKLIQPMNTKEAGKMIDRLIIEPSFRTISIWNGYHLNDMAKYKMCMEQDLNISINEMSFSDHSGAASYICSSQLERQDLTEEFRKYLIGQKFSFELSLTPDSVTEKTNAKYQVAYRIGKAVHLASGTVLKYYAYSTALDTIFDIAPDLAKNILLGKMKVSHENVIELSRLSLENIQKISQAALTGGVVHITYNDIQSGIATGMMQPKVPVARRERLENKDRGPAGIRQMPVYDPDSEVNSLCMTITSWVSSIERVNRSVDYATITQRAKLELMKDLTILEQTIHSMQKSLVERTMETNDQRTQ